MRIAADARREAGLGHLARCTALASALREEGVEPEALGLGANEPIELDGVRWEPWGSSASPELQPADLLIIDTYDRDDWARLAATPRGRLVAFVDALPDPAAADVAIALDDDSEGPARVLAGLGYACLRRDFWDLAPRRAGELPEAVLVTTGGGDPGGLATRIAARLGERSPALPVELVWGPGFEGEPPPDVTTIERPRSLLEPLLRAGVVVCAGGQTMLEAAAAGTPAVVVEAAANQRRQIAALEETGAVLAVTEEEVPAAVERLLDSASLREELSQRAQEGIDGQGARRIAKELVALERR